MSRISVKDAVKRYGNNTVIPDLDLEIGDGELFTLLGPSGCGKTTLLRMIAGFNSIEGGDIFFNEKRINDMDPSKRNIGMVFQNYAIFPNLSVRDNVAFGLKNRKVDKAEIKKRTDEFLNLMQIMQYADRMPNQLSGGQQQRIALARALVISPDVSRIRSCFSWMSRFPIWTQSSVSRCAASSATPRKALASPPCMSPTIRKRQWPSATVSPL